MTARGALATLLIGASAGAATAAVQRPRSVHGPEPGHTGGFGERTCRRCHFDGPERPTDAAVTLLGLPTAWEPAASYPLAIVVSGDAVRRGGFQLAVRYADGERAGQQAGALAGEAGHSVAVAHDGVWYLGHVAASTLPDSTGVVRWGVTWTAPAAGGGAVIFHVAANAANDDDSELGDRIVAASATVVAATPR